MLYILKYFLTNDLQCMSIEVGGIFLNIFFDNNTNALSNSSHVFMNGKYLIE